MELLAYGFNGHGQLCDDEVNRSHLSTFRKITNGQNIRILFSGWCSNIYSTENIIHIHGHIGTVSPPLNGPFTIRLPLPGIEDISDIRSVFGTHNGPLGLVTLTGNLYYFINVNNMLTLAQSGTDSSPTLSHIAITSTNRTAIIFLQARGSRMIHVLEFISFEEFKIWYTDPSAASSSNGVGNADAKQYMHHMLPGRARKLVAGATCFALLGEEGEMFTWGDARHARCLARTSDADYPADKPCLVEALGGIPIEKIDGRGWMFGALSREKDLYLWGSEKPGGKGGLKQLLGTGEEEIKLVEIDSVESVMDFGIGAGHVAVISEEGDVWVAGDNQNKQLGLGEYSEKLVGVWTKTAISNTIKPLEVVTGDLCTFLKA